MRPDCCVDRCFWLVRRRHHSRSENAALSEVSAAICGADPASAQNRSASAPSASPAAPCRDTLERQSQSQRHSRR